MLAAGIGRLVADTTDRPLCTSPGCMPVPGVVYRDAPLWTAVGNLGLIGGPSRRLAACADVRVHVPVSEKGDAAESGRTRAELSVGITGRW